MKRDACITDNAPHNETNQMSQTLSYIQLQLVPKTLTTDTRALRAELKAHYMSCNPYSSFTKVIGMKKMNNGAYEFTAIRDGADSRGNLNNKPNVIDGMKKPLEDRAFLSGSKGSIKVNACPVTDESGNGTIILLIDTIQVVHAIYSKGPEIE